MAKLHFPRKLIEQNLKLDNSTIADLSLFGTPLESLTDEEVELEISANRPDLLSAYGFLRAFQAYKGKKTGLKKYTVAHDHRPNYTVILDKRVKSCPRPHTVCAVVKNLSLTDATLKEMIQLQEKLALTLGRQRRKFGIGVYPLEKINFPARYEARKPADIEFIPLGFTKPMNAHQILQKHPMGKAYAHLLNGAERFPIFTDAKKQILSLLPIINSQDTGHVTTQTKDIFVECSGNDLITINAALSIFVTFCAEIGGTIEAVEMRGDKKYIAPDLKAKTIKLNKKTLEQTLGITLAEKEIAQLLARMGHDYKKGIVAYGCWRTDVLHEVDIIEDIAIAYGYDKFTPLIQEVPTIGEEAFESKVDTKIVESLVGLGFLETSSLHFITAEEKEKGKAEHSIEVENPRTEYAYLRPNLLIPTLRTLAHNLHAEYPHKICETGIVFSQNFAQIKEKQHLIIAHTPANFTIIKQALDYLFRMLNLNYELKETQVGGFIDGRTASVILEGKEIGFMGELHPATLREWKLKMPLAVAEISLEHIYQKLKK